MFDNYPDILNDMNDLTNNLQKELISKINNQIFDYYQVKQGDTLYKIARDNNINATLLANLNGVNEDDYIYPNQVLLIPKAGSILYFTAIGDTLNEVAKGLNISPEELLSQNNNIYLQPEQLIVYKYK